MRECLDCAYILPHPKYSVRALLDTAIKRTSRSLPPVLETDSFDFMRHYVLHEEGAVGFQIPIGLSREESPQLAFRPIAPQDLPSGNLLLGQMKGRVLPVATARFATLLIQALEESNETLGL